MEDSFTDDFHRPAAPPIHVSVSVAHRGGADDAMRDGHVLAHGTHDELLKSYEYYAELVKLSFQEEKPQQ